MHDRDKTTPATHALLPHITKPGSYVSSLYLYQGESYLVFQAAGNFLLKVLTVTDVGMVQCWRAAGLPMLHSRTIHSITLLRRRVGHFSGRIMTYLHI